MNSPAGSDNLTEAPLLTLETFTEPTPSGGLTVEPFEADHAEAQGYERTAWWRFVVPDAVDDGVEALIDSSHSSVPGSVELFLYEQDGADLIEKDHGRELSSQATPWTAGATYYVKAVQWLDWDGDTGTLFSGPPVDYVLSFGLVTYTWTDWEQGDDVTRSPEPSSYGSWEHRGLSSTSPGDGTSSTTAEQMNKTKAGFLADVPEPAYASGGDLPAIRLWESRLEIRVNSPDGPGGPWHTNGATRADHGALFGPDLSTYLFDYPYSLTAPENAIGVPELESDTLEVHEVFGSFDVNYTEDGSPGASTSLWVDVYVRASDGSGFGSDGGGDWGPVDSRLWAGTGTDTLSFDTTDVGPGGLVCVFPICDPRWPDPPRTPPWTPETPAPAGEGGYSANNTYTLTADWMSVQIGATFTPPRHRWKIRHYMETVPVLSTRPRLRKHPIASNRKWPPENFAGTSLRKIGSYP